MERVISFFGLFIMMGIGFVLCKKEHRKSINYRIVAVGVSLQFIFAVIILKTPAKRIFEWANDAIGVLLGFTSAGSQFIFGPLVDSDKIGMVFAFQVLPTIIFFSALMTVFYHLGIMQIIINVIAKAMTKTMKTSGAETLSAAANIFVGQTEAPLVIKPYVSKMTSSELFAVMVGGMATVAGGVMAAYVAMLNKQFPDIAGHLMAASVMSAPAALVMAKIMIPETDVPVTAGGEAKLESESLDANVIDAAARGAGEGLSLAMNVAGMLLAFIALIAMVNYGVGLLGHYTGLASLMGVEKLSLEIIFGYLFAPLAFIMGVPSQDVLHIGTMLGQKTIVNEFVAYTTLSEMVQPGGIELQERSVIIITYALCGFSNLSSIAIQIGGIGGIAPERRGDLARMGIRAVIAGSLACFMTAAIAGILV